MVRLLPSASPQLEKQKMQRQGLVTVTLRDYLPKDTVVVLVSPMRFASQPETLRAFWRIQLLSHEELLESAWFLVVTVSSTRKGR